MAEKQLSELIREGSKLRPQAYGVYFSNEGASCSLAAAYEALTGKQDEMEVMRSLEAVAKLNAPAGDCPDCEIDDLRLVSLIGHLNDGHKWTRERIADHLQSIGY